MITYEEEKDGFLISTDKSKLDLAVIHTYLSTESYWAQHIPFDVVKRAVDNSFCFGMYKNNKLIGFARLTTDYATFAYLADVFILADYRGKGLSKWLMRFMLTNPEVQGLRRWLLTTKDAHGLYEQFGFIVHDKPERVMYINNDYKRQDV
jgi:N-acetylglutamate synthase-like GNAT family acetyltransferase